MNKISTGTRAAGRWVLLVVSLGAVPGWLTLPAYADSYTDTPRAKTLMEPTIALIEAKRNQMQAMIVRLSADMDQINAQIADTDARDGLRPAYFANREGIQRMRGGVAAIQALIAQRSKLVDDFVSTSKDIPGSDIIMPDAKRQLVLAVRDINAKLLASYKALEAAQLDGLKVRLELLDRGEQALGTVSLEDGQLVFQRQQDWDDFQRLQARLAQAQARMQTLAATQAGDVNKPQPQVLNTQASQIAVSLPQTPVTPK